MATIEKQTSTQEVQTTEQTIAWQTRLFALSCLLKQVDALIKHEQRHAAIKLHGEHFLKMERIAGFVSKIGAGYERAADPRVLDESVEAIARNSTMPPPPNVRDVAESTLNGMAHNIEREMYRVEFPGHDVPPMPSYLNKI